MPYHGYTVLQALLKFICNLVSPHIETYFCQTSCQQLPYSSSDNEVCSQGRSEIAVIRPQRCRATKNAKLDLE